MFLKEKQGNLFSSLGSNGNNVYAHCISRDCALGKGIALQFQKEFPGVREYCLRQRPTVGQAVRYVCTRGIVYNLVTKQFYYQKPSYTSLNACLISLKIQMLKNDEREFLIPRLGCGLDRLSWRIVKGIIKEVFQNTGIRIYVYHL